MRFLITHLDGSMEESNDLSVLSVLLAELANATPEHGEVSVSDGSEWTLTAMPDGRAYWENVEIDDAPRHLSDLSEPQQLELLELAARGDRESLEEFSWNPGYGE